MAVNESGHFPAVRAPGLPPGDEAGAAPHAPPVKEPIAAPRTSPGNEPIAAAGPPGDPFVVVPGASPFLLSERWKQACMALSEPATAIGADLLRWAAARPEMQRMVESRRHEYLLARRCAGELLRQAGAPVAWVGSRADRAPDWPAGFAGSITHGAGLVAVAVGRGSGVGIDVEALLGEADRLHVETSCLTPAERQRLEPLPQAGQVALATLLFSAKEAFFKCLYPAVRCWFDFLDAEAVAVDPAGEGVSGRLRLRLLKHLAAGFGAGYELEGTFRFEQGRVFVAFER